MKIFNFTQMLKTGVDYCPLFLEHVYPSWIDINLLILLAYPNLLVPIIGNFAWQRFKSDIVRIVVIELVFLGLLAHKYIEHFSLIDETWHFNDIVKISNIPDDVLLYYKFCFFIGSILISISNTIFFYSQCQFNWPKHFFFVYGSFLTLLTLLSFAGFLELTIKYLTIAQNAENQIIYESVFRQMEIYMESLLDRYDLHDIYYDNAYRKSIN